MAEAPLPAAVAETHTGVVFFVGDRAYKLKKPVDFGFVDFTARATREAVCHRETELNRRLSPDVYLGVADVVGPDGSPCDHLVVMRRLPPERRLSALVDSGSSVVDHLSSLARLLVRFHESAARSAAIDAAAAPGMLLARWEENAARMDHLVGSSLDAVAAERVVILARAYLEGRVPLVLGRIAGGRVCDGHGDLLADDIFCLDDGPRVLDCLEFDDALRWCDVLEDVAFLAMDLERLGRPDLGACFLEEYRRLSGDHWPTSLAHLHIAYRAQVRALVYGLRHRQGDPGAARSAQQLLAMCLAHLEAGQVRLVVVGGLPGTGKSTLAAGLAPELDAVVLRSDEVRKQLGGIDPTTPSPARVGAGLYGPEVTAATYEELLRRAEVCLGLGQSVVLDASFTDAVWRERARQVASATRSVLGELHCTVPEEMAASRIDRRLAAGGDASDATVAVARHMAAQEQPWPTAATVDTSGSTAHALRRALEALGVRARG